MLFNWQVKDTCIVFRWWHISGPIDFFFSCLAIFLIAASYEWIRAYSNNLEAKWQQELVASEEVQQEEVEEQRVIVHAYQQHKR
jgi:copper transporter 1